MIFEVLKLARKLEAKEANEVDGDDAGDKQGRDDLGGRGLGHHCISLKKFSE